MIYTLNDTATNFKFTKEEKAALLTFFSNALDSRAKALPPSEMAYLNENFDYIVEEMDLNNHPEPTYNNEII